MQVKGKWLQPFFEKKSPFSDLIYWQLSKIHERGNASGSQVFPDKPLCAVPVEAFGGVSDAWKVYTRFVGKKHKDNSEKLSVRVCMTTAFPMFKIRSSWTLGEAAVTAVVVWGLDGEQHILQSEQTKKQEI